ncbi:MAG: tetratricopeptide repeat protein [Akkermansiaceae bacterium]
MKKLLPIIACLSLATPLVAQDDLGTVVNKALAAMNEGNWKEAARLNTSAVTRFGKNPKMALNLYGPQFGVILYRKGVCEMKLGEFEKAMKSFETCYKEFPNDKKSGGGNNFNKMALLKWGEAAMGAGEYELAIKQWKKFLQERDKTRDKYPQGAFHVNMAICLYNLGKLPEGNEHLEIAIKNKLTFPTPNAAIISGFQTLVDASIGAKDEQALLDFVKKNRGALIVSPFEMQRFSKVFMKLAGDAIGAKMPKTAMTLYQFVPSTNVAINDLEVRIASMGALAKITDGPYRLSKPQLEAELKALKEEQAGNKAIEMIKLAGVAYLHESNGNVIGAYASYKQLENFYPKAEKREDNLYHLVRTSSILGKVPVTQKYGELFLSEYPDSNYKNQVQQLMLSALFFKGEYELSIEIAADLINNNKVAEGTKEHDLALFVLGGSYFYTGQYDKATPHIDKHLEIYPESDFAMPAMYFRGANASRLQYWTKAARLLDEFIGKYNDSDDQSYMPLALFDRATAHFTEEEFEGALAKLEQVITRFPDSPVLDQAYNLKGNVLQSEGDKEGAEEAYLKALEIAESRNNDGVSSEALYYLVGLLGEQKKGDDPNPRLKDAVPFADKYWEEYSAGSPYNAQVAVAQVRAMYAVNRGPEALERLQKVISTMAKLPEAVGLEEAINSYTEVYLETNSPDELKEHYYNFPGISIQDKAARALLRIAIIGVFEGVGEQSEDEDQTRAAKAMITVLFQELKRDFDLKDLSTYILVKLGDYLRSNTATPLEALPYYVEAVSRQDNTYQFAALLGRADVYGNSSKNEDLARAVEDFERIFADSDDKGQRDFALYRIVEILMKKGDYAESAKRANEYLNRDEKSGPTHGFNKYSPEVGLMLAQSFEKRKKVDDAIAMYVKVWSAHMGYIPISATAILSWMELQSNRNRKSEDANIPSDRQGAYEGGYRYLELTGRFKDKMSQEEVALWEKVEKFTNKLVADPNVKSMEQIEKEKEK